MTEKNDKELKRIRTRINMINEQNSVFMNDINNSNEQISFKLNSHKTFLPYKKNLIFQTVIDTIGASTVMVALLSVNLLSAVLLSLIVILPYLTNNYFSNTYQIRKRLKNIDINKEESNINLIKSRMELNNKTKDNLYIRKENLLNESSISESIGSNKYELPYNNFESHLVSQGLNDSKVKILKIKI